MQQLDFSIILLVIGIAVCIVIVSTLLPKRSGTTVEIISIIAVLIYFFITYPISQAILYLTFGSAAYANMIILMDRQKREKHQEMKMKIKELKPIQIKINKQMKRIFVDLLLTIIVSSGAILFFIFAPEQYFILKLFIGYMLISITFETVERIGNYASSKFYWLEEEKRLLIISTFQSREFPLADLKALQVESSPDILKLHPLFSLFSTKLDFTTSFQPVIRLSFPGEDIYVTPDEFEKWQSIWSAFLTEKEEERKKVLPFWHPSNLKRLFWKGYFAVTVKGVSAYTGLLLILLWLEAPPWMIVIFVLGFWFINLYVADSVLIASTDATRLLSGDLYEKAQVIFRKAGIPNVKLFIVDSPIYNGLATGMNIGKGTVILTSATLNLPPSSIEAIFAHEAAHIKKRDILTLQMSRMVFFGLLIIGVYLYFDQLQWLAKHHKILLFVSVYVLMLAYPIYLSFVAQWVEGRADFLGATFLSNGNKQMADGLKDLADYQDKDIDRSLAYQLPSQGESKRTVTSERDGWIWRFLEFQFMSHPPMYWRIHSLTLYDNWKQARKGWLKARWTESIPDFFRKKSKVC
jgi:heat shock protein HtpX